MDPRISAAIRDGKELQAMELERAARKEDEKKRREEAERQQRRVMLRQQWIDNGFLFDRIRHATSKGESRFDMHIDTASGPLLVELLTEVPGISARYYITTEYYDEGPLDLPTVEVRW